jgi:nucleotide-binding universal stress UspA family protein
LADDKWNQHGETMTVLAAVDFSKNSYAALRRAARLARDNNQRLVAVHCVASADEDAFWRHLVSTPWEVPKKIRAVAEARLRESVQEILTPEETPDDIGYVVELKSASDGILAAQKGHDAELIVLGSTGAGKARNFLLGSSAERVVRDSPVPVLTIAPNAPSERFETVLAPIDFSDCSRKSLHMAVDIARDDQAKLLILHAFSLPAAGLSLLDMQAPPEAIEAYEQQKWALFDDFLDEVDLEGVKYSRLLRIDSPAAAIRDAVEEEGVDLICMGTHGRRGLKRFVMGSTAGRVVRDVPCSVLTVPYADEKPADEKPADEKPADEKPADEKPADEKPAGEEPIAEDQ